MHAPESFKRKKSGWRIVGIVITILAVAAMTLLGFWQLDRADQKEQRLQQINTRQTSAPLTLSAVLSQSGDVRDFHTTLTGKLKKEYIFLLDNRVMAGVVGYEVLVPVETNEGWVIANLGFIKGTGNRSVLPDVSLPENEVTVKGIVSVPQLNTLIRETATAAQPWPKVIQQVDLSVMSALSGHPLLPLVVLVSPESELGFQKNWQPVVMPPEKHIAYAIQWFGLAIACSLIFIFAFRARNHAHHD